MADVEDAALKAKKWRRTMGRIRSAAAVTMALAALTLGVAGTARAQGGPGMMGQGMMMGPGMMDRGMQGRMCSPAAAGFSEWRIERLERLLKPTEAQRAKLEELKAESTKAAEAMRQACAADIPATVVGRMAAMEKRMDAMSAAIKTVRPALEAFYATLSDEQKQRLDSNSGRGRFWHWRHRW